MSKVFLSTAALIAALATGAALVPARTSHVAAQKQTARKTAAKPKAADAQSNANGAKTKTDGVKPKADEARTKADEAKTKAAEAKPKVTEIKEAELKSLLSVGGERERPLLVNFWATWCVPCREEFPDLVRIREQYPTDKLDFVTVSLDDPSDIDKAVPEFLIEVRATSLPAYLLHAEDDGTAINMIDPGWSGELPATFLYDRAGRLVFKHKGRIKPAELRAALEQALSVKPLEAGAQK